MSRTVSIYFGDTDEALILEWAAAAAPSSLSKFVIDCLDLARDSYEDQQAAEWTPTVSDELIATIHRHGQPITRDQFEALDISTRWAIMYRLQVGWFEHGVRIDIDDDGEISQPK